ncbi:pyruvate dehydrogenase E2 component (dihydrolipoamide acetyltransferase) [Actinoalloteichus hoggarensis]|uniref:Dihydrolipoamide acetyltransferase component of pyruvate dehydrogenase complex n=1 Tax=Actinoalloteichus hoggarensis TaxID=1470176 RepID=A0A221WAK7_9PSEU|nr:dihydrolipoamide acetyltransferase family protein [Actinoalloteichus hoggarensis]ASO23118.1 Dihydrolipoyllysine-residue acetyltransferase component of pyruvate dehydrogenase complex [Actinoalloteichus hoggarensis]MBB5922724.1 pyruvate dehydrogenase E2 component (dihydrolipoamide acetyltransferase) [Actinoalloteichus hoggarensis]
MPRLKHFPLPDTGEGLTEAEIITWHVAAGDTVTVNQIIVEIETAKAVVELPCPFAGQVSQLLVEVGETVEVGVPIIAIDVDPHGSADGESTDEQAVNGAKPAEAEGRVSNLVGYGPRTGAATRRPRKKSGASAPQAAPPAPVPQPVAAVPATPAPKPAAPAAMPAGGAQPRTTGRVPLAKPPVRKLAKDAGIDLRTIVGSGANGVITREDVTGAVAAAAVPATPTRGQPAREERVPIRGVRRATAQAMVQSAFTAPHVTEFLTVDVTPMMELRARLKTHPEFQGVKITPLAFAAKALCLAVRRTPDVNATWDEQAGEIVYKSYVHLGIAAATPRGLVVPKVREAQDMSLRELAEALDALATTAREGRTTPADMVDGTITITNVGVFGVDTGTPILNPGESAILALGAIRDMPWVVDGQVVPRKVCQLALSFDHRVVDGQQGSRFLADIGALLADPGLAMTY